MKYSIPISPSKIHPRDILNYPYGPCDLIFVGIHEKLFEVFEFDRKTGVTHMPSTHIEFEDVVGFEIYVKSLIYNRKNNCLDFIVDTLEYKANQQYDARTYTGEYLNESEYMEITHSSDYHNLLKQYNPIVPQSLEIEISRYLKVLS